MKHMNLIDARGTMVHIDGIALPAVNSRLVRTADLRANCSERPLEPTADNQIEPSSRHNSR